MRGFVNRKTLCRFAKWSLFYLAFACFFEWPLLANPAGLVEASRVSADGRDTDAFFHVWNLWWVKESIFAGRWLHHCDLVFAPAGGASMVYHSFAPVRTLLSVPLTTLLPPTLVMNLWAFASFVLAGLGMALLVERETTSEAAGLLAGLAWTASAYHLHHLVRLDVQAIEFLPFLAYFVRSNRPVLAAFAWAWGALSAWYYLVLGGVAVCVLAPGVLSPRRFAALCAVFGAVVAPFALPLFLGDPPKEAIVTLEQASSNSLDLAALFLPSPRHALFGGKVAPFFERMAGYEKPAWALGFSGLAGVAFLLLRRAPMRGRLLLLAGIGLAVAIGPHVRFLGPVRIGGEPIPWPPYLVLYPLPFFGGLRAVVRWALLLLFAAVVGFGFLAARIETSSGRSRAGRATRWKILVLVVLDLLRFPETLPVPGPTEVERAIRADARPGAVLAVPPTETPSEIQTSQTYHGKPLVLGALTHVHAETRRVLFQRLPDLPRLMKTEGLLDAPPPPDLEARLAAGGVSWVVVYRGLIEGIAGGRTRSSTRVLRYLERALGPPEVVGPPGRPRIVAWRVERDGDLPREASETAGSLRRETTEKGTGTDPLASSYNAFHRCDGRSGDPFAWPVKVPVPQVSRSPSLRPFCGRGLRNPVH